MSRNLKVWLGAGLPFGLLMGAMFSVMHGPQGLWMGLVGGLVFGAALMVFIAMQEKNIQTKFGADFEGQPLVHRGLANHKAGAEMRGGYLLLTGKELIFIPHRVSLQTHSLAVPLESITAAKAGRTLGVIPNKLSVTLKTGTVETFVVWGNQEWERQLMAQVHAGSRRLGEPGEALPNLVAEDATHHLLE